MTILYIILTFAAGLLTTYFLSLKGKSESRFKESINEGIKQSNKIKLLEMYENEDAFHTVFYYELKTDNGLEPKRFLVVEGTSSSTPVSLSQIRD